MLANLVSIKNITKDIERRFLNNFIDLLILSHLYSRSKCAFFSGYDIIKFLQKSYRFLPSVGTVYSCLYQMERNGLLKSRQNGRKRIYRLTQHGEDVARAIQDGKERIVSSISMFILQSNH